MLDYVKHDLEDSVVLGQLDQGGYGSLVILTADPVETKFNAVKLLKKQYYCHNHRASQLRLEVGLLKELGECSHLFPKLYFVREGQHFVYLSFELFQGGNLNDFVRKVSVTNEYKLFIMCQLICAVHILQKRAIIHRDIKPENVFVASNGNVVLGDFGLARRISYGEKLRCLCGTIGFVSIYFFTIYLTCFNQLCEYFCSKHRRC